MSNVNHEKDDIESGTPLTSFPLSVCLLCYLAFIFACAVVFIAA